MYIVFKFLFVTPIFEQVSRLTGTDDYAQMSVEQLSALCKNINKASRKIAMEQAIREVRSRSTLYSDS